MSSVGVSEQDDGPGLSSADLVITGRFHHAIAMIVMIVKGMMVLSALFARITNQKVLPPV